MISLTSIGGRRYGLAAGILITWLACGAIGMAIGNGKGRGGEGLALGLILGVIGVIIIAVLSPTPEAQAVRDTEIARAHQALRGESPLRPCPWCAEPIQRAAVLCRYCHRDVEPYVADEPRRSSVEELQTVEREFPRHFGRARAAMFELPTVPKDQAAWLRAVCQQWHDTGSLRRAIDVVNRSGNW